MSFTNSMLFFIWSGGKIFRRLGGGNTYIYYKLRWKSKSTPLGFWGICCLSVCGQYLFPNVFFFSFALFLLFDTQVDTIEPRSRFSYYPQFLPDSKHGRSPALFSTAIMFSHLRSVSFSSFFFGRNEMAKVFKTGEKEVGRTIGIL